MKELTRTNLDGIIKAYEENCVYEKTFNLAVPTDDDDLVAKAKIDLLKKKHPKGNWSIQSRLCNESTIKFTMKKYMVFDEIDIGVLFEKLTMENSRK